MPTYKFECSDCNKIWTEHQSINIKQAAHTSNCPKCGKECENIAFGGSGFQFAGKNLNKQLTDFPDYANKISKEADKDAEEMEKAHDAYIEEMTKKDKE